MTEAADRSPENQGDAMLFDALWSGVVNDPENDERHRRFLDQARAMNALMEAARRYRALGEDPAHAETAKKRLSAIALLATNELLATKTPESARKVPAWLYVVGIAVCFGLLGWACWAFGFPGR